MLHVDNGLCGSRRKLPYKLVGSSNGIVFALVVFVLVVFVLVVFVLVVFVLVRLEGIPCYVDMPQ